MGCGDTGGQNESQQHDAPVQSSQPPCTQQRDNDDDAYYQLEPEDRVALTPSLKAIRDLLRGNPAATPEVAAALTALENALQGHPFLLADYTGALRCAQTAWKVGGGISNAWPQFAILFPQEVDLVHALRFGFPWRWLPEAEAFAVQQMLEPRDYETYTPRPVFGEEAEALDQFIAMALREGILEIATPGDKIRCHRLRIFSQPKPDGSLRFVMDYRSLNHFLQRIPMKMTGVPHLAQRLHQGDYMTAIDFRKYYRQYKVPASGAAMQMISDSTGRTDYKMPTIGMGHIQAAEQTTRPIRKISQLLRGWQIKNINYLDELLAWHKHKAAAYIGMMATVIILHLLKCSKWRLQAYGTKEELLRAGSPNYWATLPHIEENPASTDQRYQTLRPSKWFMDLAGRTKFMQSLATSRAFENNLTFQGRQVRNRIWMQRTRKQRQQATVKMIYSEERDQQLSADRVSTIVKELLRTQMPEGKQLSQKFKPAHLRHAAASILYHGKMELAGTMTDEQVRKFMRHTSVYVTKQHYVPPEIPATIAQRWADAGPERYKQWCTTEWLFC